MGKTEGTGKNWHGHVTAITVAPEYRRLGLAEGMMNLLEQVSEKAYDCWFVDLYVRVSNSVAIDMYRKFGYSVYRRVRNYYAGLTNEDAFGMKNNTRILEYLCVLLFAIVDMRKPLPRDTQKETIRENGENVFVNPEDLDSWR